MHSVSRWCPLWLLLCLLPSCSYPPGEGEPDSVDPTLVSYSGVVDVTAPFAPKIMTPAPNERLAPGIVLISGFAEERGLIKLSLNGREVRQGIVDPQGYWAISARFSLGSYQLIANVSDAAGNTSNPSEPVSFTVSQGYYAWGCSTLPSPSHRPWQYAPLALLALHLARHRRRRQ